MSTWGDADVLVELLDRQFNYLLELSGTAQIKRLQRVIKFLQDEPRLVGILEDLRIEANDALGEYDEVDQVLRGKLDTIWKQHGPAIRERLASVSDGALHAYGHLDGFEDRLAVSRAARFNERASDSHAKQTEGVLAAARHWWKWCSDLAAKQGPPLGEELDDVGIALNLLTTQHWHASRKLMTAGSSLGWPAYERLQESATLTNPVPPNPADSTTWATFPLNVKFAQTLDQADEGPVDIGDDHDVDEVYRAIKADAKLLHEELRLRVGLGRSRLGLVRRYAAGSEAFHAERLRTACAADSRNAERTLTLDLARFLFDAGLSPLIDATTSGLRPDILHVGPSALFYVEAKQYDSEHPRPQIKKAYLQVWGTWGRLRKAHPQSAREAFLVVFRRGGPWIELPEVVRHDGLKLYSVVVDISTSAGSGERLPVIHLPEDELRPVAGSEPTAAEGDT